MSNTHDNSDFRTCWKWFLLAGVVPIVLGWFSIAMFCIGASWGGSISLPTGSLQSAGQFGDAFGFVNAVVSALAFCAVAITLRLQSIEIKEQRLHADLDRADQQSAIYLSALVGWRDSNFERSDDTNEVAMRKLANLKSAERQMNAIMKDRMRSLSRLFPDVDFATPPREQVAAELIEYIAEIDTINRDIGSRFYDGDFAPDIAKLARPISDGIEDINERMSATDLLPNNLKLVFGKVRENLKTISGQAGQCPSDQVWGRCDRISKGLREIIQYLLDGTVPPRQSAFNY